MKQTKKIILSAIGLIAVGIVGALLTYQKGEAGDFEINKTATQSFTSIHASADNAAIEVKKVNGKEAKAILTGNQNKGGEVQLESKIHNGEWNITVKESMRPYLNFNFFTKTRKLTIYLPEKTYKQISLRSDNGSIVADHTESKSIDIESSNGRIELTELKAENIQARTDNGKLSFTNTTGNIHARSDNGRIDFKGKTISHNLDFETDNGRIQIELNEKPEQLQIEAQTDFGKVHLFGEKYNNQTFIKGSGPDVRLRTDNGRIEVNAN